jgi:hypothetical protein
MWGSRLQVLSVPTFLNTFPKSSTDLMAQLSNGLSD